MLMKDANNTHYESLSEFSAPGSPNSGQLLTPPGKVLLQVGRITLTLDQLRYFSFVMLGVAVLWPWNCFLSASAYFVTKFGNGSVWGRTYSSTTMTVSTLTSLCFNSVLSTRQNANYRQRILRGNLLNFANFLVLAFIELVDPSLHSGLYYIFIMGLVALSSLGTALQQNGCMALANVQGPEYAQAAMVGQAIAGVLPSLSLVMSEVAYSGKTEEKSSATIVIYFAMTSLITLLAGVLFSIVSKFDGSPVTVDEESNGVGTSQYVPFMVLFKQLKWIVCAIVLAFVSTLVFPIFASNTSSVHTGRLFEDKIFIPFAFLVWNLGDLVGRVSCGWDRLVIESDIKVFAYSIARFAFIPLLFLCNLDSVKGHALIRSDLFYLLIQFLFGFTNGHQLSCCFMNVPSYVDDSAKEAAGGFSTVFLSAGLLLGSVFSYAFVPLVG